jgi:hypothetical protein
MLISSFRCDFGHTLFSSQAGLSCLTNPPQSVRITGPGAAIGLLAYLYGCILYSVENELWNDFIWTNHKLNLFI